LEAALLVKAHSNAQNVEEERSRKDSLQDNVSDELFRLVSRRQDGARCLEQLSILNARGTRRLAGAAVQAPIDVQPKVGTFERDPPFLERAHLVDPAARRVKLGASQLVGGARR
jgi:hypothetical protein